MTILEFEPIFGSSLPSIRPQRVTKLALISEGLRLETMEGAGVVPFTEIVGLLVTKPDDFKESIPVLLLFLSGKVQPLLIRPVVIEDEGFPPNRASTLIEKMRSKARHLCRLAGEVRIDSQTMSYLRGGPLPARKHGLVELSTASARALAAAGVLPSEPFQATPGRSLPAIPLPSTSPQNTDRPVVPPVIPQLPESQIDGQSSTANSRSYEGQESYEDYDSHESYYEDHQSQESYEDYDSQESDTVLPLDPEKRVSWRQIAYYPFRDLGSVAFWLTAGVYFATFLYGLSTTDEWGNRQEGHTVPSMLVSVLTLYVISWICAAVLRGTAAGDTALRELPAFLDVRPRLLESAIFLAGVGIVAIFEALIAFIISPLVAQGNFFASLGAMALRFTSTYLMLLTSASAIIYRRPLLVFRLDMHLGAFARTWLRFLGFFLCVGVIAMVVILTMSLVVGTIFTSNPLQSDNSIVIAAAVAPLLLAAHLTLVITHFVAMTFRRYKTDLDSIYLEDRPIRI